MSNTSWNHDHVTGTHFNGGTLRAAKPQRCRTAKNAEYFMRRAVVMRKRIDACPPRTGPIVFGEALFYDGSKVLCICSKCFAVKQQRKRVIRNSAVVF